MCGIAGVYSTQFQLPESELFQRLLLLNAFRGMDSTGVIKIRNKPKFTSTKIKAVMPSPAFIFTERGSNFLKEKDNILGFIGHTRAATKGDVTIKNAHPFEFENVVGVHNGTIQYKFKGSEDYETDSEALYKLINDIGIKEALDEVAYSSAAYALVYIDKKEGTINFIKNSKRPLCFTYLYGRGTLAWSSTREALEFGVKNGCSTMTQTGWDSKDTDDPYFTLKNNQLMTIRLGDRPDKAVLTTLDIEEHTYNYSGHNSRYSNGFQLNDDNTWVKGSDGQYRTRKDEKARLKALEEASAWSEHDDGKMSESELDRLFGKRNRPGGGDYGNFRENSTDLTLLPWLPDSETKETPAKGGSRTPSVGAKAKETTKVTPPKGGRPMSIPERDYKLSCGCFACGEKIGRAHV